nr:TIGR03943 family protein [uncultured Caproiciproducens sp.]
MKRKLNFEVLLQLIILLGLAVLLIFALISGKAQDYVHPRLNGYLWFSVAALFGIGFFMLPGLSRPKHNTSTVKYLIILFPMVTAVLLPTGIIQSKAITLGGTTASSTGQLSQSKGTIIPDTFVPQDDIGIETNSSAAEPQKDAGGVTNITDEQFADWYANLNRNMKQYEGQTFRFKGQVFRMNTFAKNEFVPVRYAMVCCAADLQPCGVLCRSDHAKSLKDDDWVWITGKLKIEDYDGQTMPVCYVTAIEKAEPATQKYIYFTY